MLGLYIHVPFCASKCPYCDFYSLPSPTASVMDEYAEELARRLSALPSDIQADTLYFGGGTPSLLGGKRLSALLNAARPFLTADAEVTLEANPADELFETFCAFRDGGGNRLSMGMQAATADGLTALGRRHTTNDLARAVEAAHKAGLHNLSLDIMLATPKQTAADIDRAVQACIDSEATHVSAYLLKTEPGTPFFERRETLALPDEDEEAALYLHACERLEGAGYTQYEISNFAKDGCQSRHNLKYWNGEPYLGLGPSAHSFYRGERTCFPRSLTAFLQGATPVKEDPDSVIEEDSAEEYMLLRLRLCDGIDRRLFEARFGVPVPFAVERAALRLPPSLVTVDERRIALTREGFLLSNALIAKLLWDEAE
ncbi:MAG: radical SAM family heme chaperone HemW [Clostridia bacterium]|nr:radical SAM family heme chaperone HemW [Clostridia bacterium]